MTKEITDYCIICECEITEKHTCAICVDGPMCGACADECEQTHEQEEEVYDQ